MHYGIKNSDDADIRIIKEVYAERDQCPLGSRKEKKADKQQSERIQGNYLRKIAVFRPDEAGAAFLIRLIRPADKSAHL
jgi:hypothetical protein